MSIASFNNKKELVKFARAFLRDHVDAFRKGMAICMTPNVRGQHAYFPQPRSRTVTMRSRTRGRLAKPSL
jgi:hypothetical protein